MLQLYYMDVRPLEDADTFRRILASLSPARQEAVRGLRQQSSRLQSLGAGYLLDHCLRTIGLREAQMRYRCGAYGKPQFARYPELQFSLSHSGTMAVAALSDREIGCDVQQITDLPQKIARRRFAAEERAYIFAPEDPAAQRDRFFQIWTLKESYCKATGEGLHLPLDAFCVTVGEHGATVRHGTEVPDFRLYTARIEGYAFAVCAGEKQTEIIFSEIRL